MADLNSNASPQKISNIGDYQALRGDFMHLMSELSKDKQDVIKELDQTEEINGLLTRETVKRKIDALAWHGRLIDQLSINQVQEALVLFKKSLLPSDNNQIRNGYIKLRDHRSHAVVSLVAILRTEALQEKMTLRSVNGLQNDQDGEGPFFKRSKDNSVAQRKIFQILSILEPLLLNDENVVKALNIGLVETLSEMLIFQSQNLSNIHKILDLQNGSSFG